MTLTLADVIGAIEDGSRIWPPRFEPGTYLNATGHRHETGKPLPTVQAIIECNGGAGICSIGTAEMLYATSWGRFQFMGMTLYSTVGYKRSVLDFLNSLDDQNAAFDRFTVDGHIAFTVDELRADPAKREQFARVYNGPDAIEDYSAKIAEAIARLSAQPAAA